MTEPPPLAVGATVTVKHLPDVLGNVRFMGVTEFSAGEWVGVELVEPKGKNDGSVKGVRYFECQPSCGIFVRAKDCTVQIVEARPPAATEGRPVEAGGEEECDVDSQESESGEETATDYKLRMAQLRAHVQRQLAEAMEDHDTSEVQQILPLAVSSGVNLSEIQAAYRMLERERVAPIVRAVDEVYQSVAALSQQASAQSGASSENNEPPSWLDEVGSRLEQQVWESMQPKVDAALQSVVDKLVVQISDVVKDVKAQLAE